MRLSEAGRQTNAFRILLQWLVVCVCLKPGVSLALTNFNDFFKNMNLNRHVGWVLVGTYLQPTYQLHTNNLPQHLPTIYLLFTIFLARQNNQATSNSQPMGDARRQLTLGPRSW